VEETGGPEENHWPALSARYAGVLVGVTSAFGTLGAIAVPLVTGEFTKERVSIICNMI
jgi:hypothetical protein